MDEALGANLKWKKKKIDVVNLIVRKETALNLIEAKGGVWHAPSFVFFLFFYIPSISAFLFLKRRGNSREWGCIKSHRPGKKDMGHVAI